MGTDYIIDRINILIINIPMILSVLFFYFISYKAFMSIYKDFLSDPDQFLEDQVWRVWWFIAVQVYMLYAIWSFISNLPKFNLFIKSICILTFIYLMLVFIYWFIYWFIHWFIYWATSLYKDYLSDPDQFWKNRSWEILVFIAIQMYTNYSWWLTMCAIFSNSSFSLIYLSILV